MTRTPPPLDAPITSADLEFRFRAGRVSLYLVETFGEWTNRRYERINSPQRWSEWLHAAGLPALAAAATPADLGLMKELRAALYELARARIKNWELPHEAVLTVNTFAASPPPVAGLAFDGSAEVKGADTRQILSALARDAIDLFSGRFGHSIKECDDIVCPTMFVDVSRGQNRRWCSPTCGARNAEADYRRRHRSAVLERR